MTAISWPGWGGDEFAILLRDLRREEDIAAVIEALLDRIRMPIELSGREISPSMSIGVAVQQPLKTSAEELYRNADSALYHSKASGRNTWSLFDTHLRERIAQRTAIAHALEEAVCETTARDRLSAADQAGYGGALRFRKSCPSSATQT